MKICQICKTNDQSLFGGGKDRRCKPCNRERAKKMREKNPERYRKSALDYYWRNRKVRNEKHRVYELKVKDEVFEHYGGYVCACCGDKHKAFLTIDHINGGGTKQRKLTGGGGKFHYYWLRRNKYPEGFRVLCFNCNSGRAQNSGICPHQEEII